MFRPHTRQRGYAIFEKKEECVSFWSRFDGMFLCETGMGFVYPKEVCQILLNFSKSTLYLKCCPAEKPVRLLGHLGSRTRAQ